MNKTNHKNGQRSPKLERRPLRFRQHKGVFKCVTREDKLYFQPLSKKYANEQPTVFIKTSEFNPHVKVED